MIQSQNLIDKICCRINQGGMTSLETCQTTNALNLLANNIVVQVTSFSNLPAANLYEGRMIYVNDENRYYYSIGTNWINDFTSTLGPTNTFLLYGVGNDIGDGTDLTRTSPTLVSGNFVDWKYVEVGNNHQLGIRSNGTLWTWGLNTCGSLGDGTTIAKLSPVSVVGGFTDWCQVSAGGTHSLGIRTNGTAWAWGNNGQGRLGDNSTVNKSSPVSVIGGFTDWCQVSAGTYHSLGLRTNGTAWAWGGNTCGILGDGTTVNKSSPISVIGGFTDWCQVSAGHLSSLAIRTNGTAWAWGHNNAGQLGDGTTINSSSPVSVIGGFTDWCQVSIGGTPTNAFAHAIRTNGSVWNWGCAANGVLGPGGTNKSSPVSAFGGVSASWCMVSGSGSTVIALGNQRKGF